ncbi:MAG: glycosyltransferase family 2 protein [Candidatus Aminicenantes bacterium]|nr:glycosyltransferase family 2 protein [Candidatus Aminicenantes bacterium]
MDISVVIITFNEEKRLEPALKSVAGVASETIVVDSHSTDGTVKLARRYTPKVFERKWTNFADQKNFANAQAAGPWILSLDADERLSPELRDELLELRRGEPDCAGFSMPRQVYYLGRWIRHSGWYPDRKVRLFRQDRAVWEGDYVHESLVLSGSVGRLRGAIHHFTYDTISAHVARINTFSALGAQKLYARGEKGRFVHLLVLPWARFFKSYILKLGVLDGFPGLVISALNGYAVFLRYAKLREIWKKGERIEPVSY